MSTANRTAGARRTRRAEHRARDHRQEAPRLIWNEEVLREHPGEWANDRKVYQDLCPLPSFDGNYPVLGAWLINGWPAGLGIRESSDLITGNLSHFVPHIITR